MKIFKRKFKTQDGIQTSRHFYCRFTVHGCPEVYECLYEENKDRATKKAAELYDQMVRQARGENNEIPLLELVEDFLEYSERKKVSFSSDVGYARNVAAFFRELEGKTGHPFLVLDLTKKVLRDFDTYLIKKGLNPCSRSHQHNFIRTCVNYAYKETRRITQLPQLSYKGLIVQASRGVDPQVFTVDQIDRLLSWAFDLHHSAKNRSRFYFFPYVYIVLNTVARPAEVFRMSKRDVGETKTRLIGCGNKLGRELPTLPNLYQFVHEYLPGGKDEMVIQTGQQGTPTFRKLFNQAAAELKFKSGLQLKHLRHSAITYLLEKKVPLHVVAAIAGHTSPATTLRHYATARIEGMQEAMLQLQGFGGGQVIDTHAPSLPKLPRSRKLRS